MQEVFAVMAWTIMKCFGGVKVEDKLNGNQIHRLENIITMRSSNYIQLHLRPTMLISNPLRIGLCDASLSSTLHMF